MLQNLTIVAGARPNFIKIAPIIHAIQAAKNNGIIIKYRLVHTGQHYDVNMSDSFFKQLNIPKPHVNLNCSSGSHSELTAAILVSFEKELLNNATDLVLVVGDVTSTMACALVAQKMQIKVAHIEAGIRSHDWTMPEDINRLVTDSITNYFFTTSDFANANLKASGVNDEVIFYVGNTMIDTLVKQRQNFKRPKFWNQLKLKPKSYIVVTLHRPSNVDKENKLDLIISEIIDCSRDLQIIFPVHPRTAKVIDKLNLSHSRLHLVEPISYLEFNFLVENSKAVITDSGGITEETTVMGIPCMTLRDTTERPETVSLGTNELVGSDPKKLSLYMDRLFSKKWKKGSIPHFWDGKTSERIVDVLAKL